MGPNAFGHVVFMCVCAHTRVSVCIVSLLCLRQGFTHAAVYRYEVNFGGGKVELIQLAVRATVPPTAQVPFGVPTTVPTTIFSSKPLRVPAEGEERGVDIATASIILFRIGYSTGGSAVRVSCQRTHCHGAARRTNMTLLPR